jgi:hypothetical protein
VVAEPHKPVDQPAYLRPGRWIPRAIWPFSALVTVAPNNTIAKTIAANSDFEIRSPKSLRSFRPTKLLKHSAESKVRGEEPWCNMSRAGRTGAKVD